MSQAPIVLVHLGPGDPGLVTLRARDALLAASAVYLVGADAARVAKLAALVTGLGVSREKIASRAPADDDDVRGAVIAHGASPDGVSAARSVAQRLAMRANVPLLRVPGVSREAATEAARDSPLFEKRVLVLRAKEQSQDAESVLYAYGAEPVSVPALTIEPPPDPARLERAVREASHYDFIVFTSRNGVARFFDVLCTQLGRDARALAPAKIAAIGPKTAEALREHGVRADLVAKEFVGESLAKDLGAALLPAGAGDGAPAPPAKILLPRALVARDVMPDALRAAGHTVDVVPAYETRGPTADDRARLAALFAEKRIDAVLFTSSSTVTHTMDALGEGAASLLASVCVASIGPVTTDTATARGVRVDVTASVYTVEGAVLALSAFLGETR